MRYEDLFDLVRNSSSTRRYFYTLPPEMQLAVSEHRYGIHTAAELREAVYRIEGHRRAVAVSTDLFG